MSSGARIHVLSDEVANKIAAGEVVDRPASVLKELIENSVDAGATQIDIEVVAGGRQAIVVSDNGRGMIRDDAILSVERHATSKIREVEDIENVSTLGFRGEALAAISSVSRFTLLTRPADADEGTELSLSGGRMLEVREAGCPPGTSIAVRNLFHNVPARRKFLRSDQTELSHLRQVFLVCAMAHPRIGFRLVVDEREVYRLATNSSLEDRVRDLFGSELLAGLRPVSFRNAEVEVSGFTSLPHVTRGDRSEQFTFVNGRPATASVIGYALNEAYQHVIPKGRHPVVVLFLTMAPDLVDVNVHPTKKEVRFRHGPAVRDVIIGAIGEALAFTPTAPTPAGGHAAVDQLLRATRDGSTVKITDLPELPAFQYPRAPLHAPEAPAVPLVRTELAQPAQESAGATRLSDTPWSWCRILGQVGGLYVVMETEDGLVIMDPHAAHERVLFDRFMREVVANQVKAQGLLAAESVELGPENGLIVRKNLKVLQEMGFGISDFGGDAFLVDAMPVCLGNVSPSAVLSEIARTLEQGGVKGGTEHWAEERVAQAACKAAVKANDRLSVSEMEQLVVDLAKTDMPYTCPHGRPTTIFMSFSDLRRKFGRE